MYGYSKTESVEHLLTIYYRDQSFHVPGPKSSWTFINRIKYKICVIRYDVRNEIFSDEILARYVPNGTFQKNTFPKIQIQGFNSLMGIPNGYNTYTLWLEN